MLLLIERCVRDFIKPGNCDILECYFMFRALETCITLPFAFPVWCKNHTFTCLDIFMYAKLSLVSCIYKCYLFHWQSSLLNQLLEYRTGPFLIPTLRICCSTLQKCKWSNKYLVFCQDIHCDHTHTHDIINPKTKLPKWQLNVCVRVKLCVAILDWRRQLCCERF